MSTNTTTTIDIPGTLDNRTVHVVCIIDPPNHYTAVYTNAVLEQALTNTWPPFTSVSTAWSFIGRSLFSTDAWLNGTIDELRLYDGRLTPEDIAGDYTAGPDTLFQKVSLAMTKTSGGYTFNWPSHALGFTLQSSAALGNSAVWNPVGGVPVISNGLYWLSVPVPVSNSFFRLSR